MLPTASPAFRFMRAEDCVRDDVISFSCGSMRWDEEVAEYLRSGDAWSQHRPPKQVTLLYCADGGIGAVIGFVNQVRKEKPDPDLNGVGLIRVLHLTNIAVSDQFQGQGHGKTMLRAVLYRAKHDGYQIVDLFVHQHNHRAIGLYAGLGFQVLRGAEYLAGEDRYLKMAKNMLV